MNRNAARRSRAGNSVHAVLRLKLIRFESGAQSAAVNPPGLRAHGRFYGFILGLAVLWYSKRS